MATHAAQTRRAADASRSFQHVACLGHEDGFNHLYSFVSFVALVVYVVFVLFVVSAQPHVTALSSYSTGRGSGNSTVHDELLRVAGEYDT